MFAPSPPRRPCAPYPLTKLVSLVDPTKVVARPLPNSVVGVDAVLVRTWPAAVAEITFAGSMAVFL